jgi:hypothetical protein
MDCGAKRRNGERCRGRAMSNGRCRLHGGTSLGGIASPSLRTGRYSKYLPARLQERYQRAQADPDLLALRDEVALLDARLADVLSRADVGESAALWDRLHDAWTAFQGGDATALAQVGRLIEGGIADWSAWREIARLIDQRRQLVESERKRLVELQQVLTAEQALVLLAAVTDAVRRHVHDRPTLAAISGELVRLTTGPVGGGARPAS